MADPAPNPDRRFDYVFYSRAAGFNAVESQVIVNTDTDTASDHYPVFTDFEWDGATWAIPPLESLWAAARSPARSGTASPAAPSPT